MYCSDAHKEQAYRERKVEPKRQQWRQRWAGYLPETRSLLESLLLAYPEAVETATSAVESERIALVSRIEVLERKLAKEQALASRAKLVEQMMLWGELLGYRRLIVYGIKQGPDAWRDFIDRADDELLVQAIATAQYFHEGLAASGRAEARITELEQRLEAVKDAEQPKKGTPR